jgi:hypothetical protein
MIGLDRRQLGGVQVADELVDDPVNVVVGDLAGASVEVAAARGMHQRADVGARGAVRDQFAHRDHDLDLSVLDVLGMDEHAVLDQAELLRQHGADQPIEVASGDEPISRSVATSSLLTPADARLYSSGSAAAPRP